MVCSISIVWWYSFLLLSPIQPYLTPVVTSSWGDCRQGLDWQICVFTTYKSTTKSQFCLQESGPLCSTFYVSSQPPFIPNASLPRTLCLSKFRFQGLGHFYATFQASFYRPFFPIMSLPYPVGRGEFCFQRLDLFCVPSQVCFHLPSRILWPDRMREFREESFSCWRGVAVKLVTIRVPDRWRKCTTRHC
jgi:hypothetical protein